MDEGTTSLGKRSNTFIDTKFHVLKAAAYIVNVKKNPEKVVNVS